MTMTELEIARFTRKLISVSPSRSQMSAATFAEVYDSIQHRITALEAANKEAEPFSPEALEAKITAIEELIEPFSQRNTDASVQYQHLSLRVERLEKPIERFSDRFDCVPLRVSVLEVAVGKMQAAQAAQEGQPCSS